MTPPLNDSDSTSLSYQTNRSPESPDGASAAVPIQRNTSVAAMHHSKLTHKHMCEMDWLWLNACKGVIDGQLRAVDAFLIRGGDPSRQISQVS